MASAILVSFLFVGYILSLVLHPIGHIDLYTLGTRDCASFRALRSCRNLISSAFSSVARAATFFRCARFSLAIFFRISTVITPFPFLPHPARRAIVAVLGLPDRFRFPPRNFLHLSLSHQIQLGSRLQYSLALIHLIKYS
jgi:hypothetical protein